MLRPFSLSLFLSAAALGLPLRPASDAGDDDSLPFGDDRFTIQGPTHLLDGHTHNTNNPSSVGNEARNVLNLRPVIGVFSQRTDTAPAPTDATTGEAIAKRRYYIPASYVSWIGQAGGRVLPILLDKSREYYEDVFNITSGILFPGGGQGIDPEDVYTQEGKILWDLAKVANDAGHHYPIWGTCLGFQEMAVLAAEDSVISNHVRATNVAMPLNFVPGAETSSRLLRSLPLSVVSSLRQRNVTFNSHNHGLLAQEYGTNDRLNSFFRVVSYNSIPGAVGHDFVSTMEARHYPFYGTQWHPEKNNFEWSQSTAYSNIPRGREAVAVSRETAEFFLSEARQCPHMFPEERRDDLVYSADLLYTGRGDWAFEQVYIF